MLPENIEKEMARVVTAHGPWTAYNIKLCEGVETAPHLAGPHLRLRRAVQAITDFAGKPWRDLRILDLASLEGIFALEFAMQGATVVGIEGREANNARARFAAETLGIRNVEFITDDVRNLRVEKYGHFDVVFCSGILYHLGALDGCEFVKAIGDVCTRLAIIDTHVGLRTKFSVTLGGRRYFGTSYREHRAGDTAAVKESRTLSSLDNDSSFWITEPSLINLLRDSGFSSVTKVLSPRSFAHHSDRLTFAALKNARAEVFLSPELASTPEEDWPEGNPLSPHPSQAVRPYLFRLLAKAKKLLSF